MKNRFCVYISAVPAVLSGAAALFFLRFWLGIAVCTAVLAAWAVLFVRFCTIRYEFTGSEIMITGGWLFKYKKTVKRSSILSVSRISFIKIPVFTMIKTASDTVILFCEFDPE